jgi:hypothetical protein
MLKPFIAAAVAAIAACANAPAAQTIAASDGSAAVGRMYHYTRSNQDGSIPEQIYQYRASATRIEVGKQVSPCTNSAYVTAAFDPERGHGVEFVGGRLARDLSPIRRLRFRSRRPERALCRRRARARGFPLRRFPDLDRGRQRQHLP